MISLKLPALALLGASTLALGGCYDDGYGYGGLDVGYGAPYGYYDGYYDGGYAPSYYGWYGGSYYPGSGYYVYDRNRNPRRWDHWQRDYWRNRGNGEANNGDHHWNGGDHHWNGRGGTSNWSGFHNEPSRNPNWSAGRGGGNFGGHVGGGGHRGR